jgi:hypothetical protein
MVFRVERQNLGIGLGGSIEIAGLFQREGAVIGFRERIFVDFLHGRVFYGPGGVLAMEGTGCK